MLVVDEVWLVTTGSYSDYSVLCACPDEVTAQAIVAAIGPDDSGYYGPRVEDVWLRSELPVVKQIFRLRWVVTPDGEENPYPHQSTDSEGWVSREYWWGESQYGPCKKTVRRVAHEKQWLQLAVEGWDHERVRKVFSESKARIKADQLLLIERLAQGQEISEF